MSRTPCPLHDGAIQRDVGRTLPREELFQDERGKGQGALFRLLRALAHRHCDIGYVQGLNFVVATFIGVFPGEEALAFSCVQALLFRHALADFYRPGFPRLGVTVWQFDRIVEAFLPETHDILQQHGVTAEYYAMQWFLTIFAGVLPQLTVRRIWDRFLIAGWQVVVQVGLALLVNVRDELAGLDTSEALVLLKKFVRSRRFSTEELLDAALKFEVSHQMLSELEAAYCHSGGSGVRLVVSQGADSSEKLQWSVQRDSSNEHAPGQLCTWVAQGRGKCAGSTVLPFIIHNLDTGETELLEQEWGEYIRDQRQRPQPTATQLWKPVSPKHGQFEREPCWSGKRPFQGRKVQVCASGGSFWLQGRQRQALWALGKA
jgi:hypothetical protein